MTTLQVPQATQYTSSLSDRAVITAAINNALPPLRSLSAQERQAMREAPPSFLPWLDNATAFNPELLKELQRQHVRFRNYERLVNNVLATIPDIEDFAEPILREAIEHTFQRKVDVRKTFLFNAGRMQVDDSFVNPADPITAIFKARKESTCSLLNAALQNFEERETQVGAMDGPGDQALIFTTPGGTAMEVETTAVDIAPERFAALCRTLDLGARYQQLISAAFAPPPGPQESEMAATINRRGIFKLLDQVSLRLHLAYLQARLGETTYQRLLEASNNVSLGRGTVPSCSFLRLWDVELCGVMLFRSPSQATGIDHVVLYVPEDPQRPLMEFDSASACYHDLRDRLLQPAYRTFFLRFIPARHRAEVMRRLKHAINPSVWNSGGWYEEGFDKDAHLHFEEQPVTGTLLNLMLEQKVRVLKDDGLFHAVPTAQKDDESARGQLLAVANIAFNVLNVASFVVPGLGEVMLAVTAAQLGFEVYEGFDSLAQGEQEQAWTYLMDVAENVLTGVALVAVVGNGTIPAPAPVRAMRPVELPFGGYRLWKPDIAPYAHTVDLPENLVADAKGLYQYEGRQWLKLDGHTYAVQPSGDGGYAMEHPSRSTGYRPVLRHNGEGGWLHELDDPATWPGQTLFRRLGPRYAELPDDVAQQAMAVSGITEAHLRQAMITAARPPALFADTVARFRLARQLAQDDLLDAHSFDAGYWDSQPAPSEEGEVLLRAFPGIPTVVLEELLSLASASELTQLRSSARVPLRLAAEARAFQQEVRLARAYEGLFFDPALNPDSGRLMLHGLERLPGWPDDLRLEIRNDTLAGPLLDSIGPSDAVEPIVVIRERSGYRTAGGSAGFCEALFAQLPAHCRTALEVSNAQQLLDKLQRLPLLPRARARSLLKMQALKPGFRSPMKLANGRVGFPLSGGLAEVILRDSLLDKIRLLQLDTLQAEQVYERLSSAGLDRSTINARLDELLEQQRSLRECLDRWTMDSSAEHLDIGRQSSRSTIHDALWLHWEANLLPELGRARMPLTLDSIYLADLPDNLPPFYRDSVTGLVLRHVRSAPWLEEYPRVVDLGAGWPASFGQFGQLSSLEVQGAGWRSSLPREVAVRYPLLQELRLVENGLRMDSADFDAFARLPRLRRLDLSGNRLGPVFNVDRFSLTLDYLGMEDMRLESWPHWLDADALSRIGGLSLGNNRLGELPPMVMAGRFQEQWGRRLTLSGNPLSGQVLLDLRLAEGAPTDPVYHLDAPLASPDLHVMLGERAELAERLDEWVNEVEPGQEPDARRVAERRRLSRVMLEFWREDLRQDASVVLKLEHFSVASFPRNLPAFFYRRVAWMELREFEGTAAEIESFLLQFQWLVDIGLTDVRTPLAYLPDALTSLEHLSELALVRLGITIGQAEMERILQMPRLASLQLDGNRLGDINVLPVPSSLKYLSLAEMSIVTWPDWLMTLAQNGIEMLNLDGNLMTELPETILANRRRDSVGVVEITLRGNPFTTETMTRAHLSQDYNRPYSLTMDLPPEIEMLSRTPHSSDTESDIGGDDGVDEDWTPQPVAWEVEDAAQGERFGAAWHALQHEADARRLLRMIDRLRQTADYRSPGSRPELVARVLRVLEAAGQDPALRQLLDGMAEEPLLQFQQHQTCPDGIRIEFNQMEIHIYTQEALRNIDPDHRAGGLFRLMRRLFRSQRLDAIAREQAGGRDEAEVRMAYRLRWGNELDLPEPPRHMLFRGSAAIRPGELDAARTALGQAERGRPLLDYAASCEFWVSYLREAFPLRFASLKETFEASVLELIDLYPEDSVELSSGRIRTLEANFKEDERALIDELTIAERALHD